MADPATSEGVDQSPSSGRQPSSAARVGLIALGSAVLGVLAGVLAAVGVLSSPGDDEPAPVAPIIQVSGSEDLDRVSAVVAAAGPSVVTVDVVGDGSVRRGNGSGAIVSGEGHIITNLHVVAGATSIAVAFMDGAVEPARLVGEDPDHDLALIQVSRTDLPPLSYADSDAVVVGQLAVVIGAPFGLSGSVTVGVVSAVERPIDIIGLDGAAIRIPSVIQTDAEINPGNSGGPVVDSHGQLIGITSAILSGGGPTNAGVGFAVPADVVARTVASLIAEGAVPRPYLGVTGRAVTIAEQAEGQQAGAFVEEVTPSSPAAIAGLSPGDVLVDVDGERVRSMDDLAAVVNLAGVDARIVVTRIRGGTTETVEAVLTRAS